MSAERAAEHLIAAYRSGKPVSPMTEATPATLADAYAIQARVMSGLGEPVGAFKIGRKSADEVPVYAPIRRRTIWDDGATVPAEESRLRGVELEVAFRFIAAPPRPDAPGFEDALAAAVVALPALEIVEARLADPDAGGANWKLADNQANGGIVLGAPVADWRGLDLAAPAAQLQIGASTVFDKVAAAPGGDPFASLAAFARVVGDHCGGLRDGTVVICGSLTGVDYAKAGDLLSGQIEGLGAVTAAFR